MSAKKIVILGASFAGVSTAHRILKQVGKAGVTVKVTLISPNSHFYWNIAVPRALIHGQIPDEKLFQSIADGFKQYPAVQFEFIVASAKSLDVEGKKVELEILGSAGGRTLNYDFLVLATGTSTKEETPLKTLISTETTKDRLHGLQAEIKKAKTIVLAGAGPTGVETAGELAFEYGKQKEIILLASGSTILESAIPSVSKTATQLLQNLHVEIRLNTKVDGTVQGVDGRQTISLAGGKKLNADVYIPTFGVIPNSSYIPNKYLNGNGFVIVDDYLKVKDLEDVWAIGDVSDHEPPQFMFADKQAAYLAKNILLILGKKAPLPYKDATRGMGLLVGKKAGTGHLGSVKLPGFLVTLLRKNLFLDNLGPTVTGSAF
ncbi:putative apoptosis-inducing factor [Stipitochalara longipes BDJ]|nr:putative apoptosis-inducing factor [Stipitochalara longipes BDJ]